MKKDEKIEGFWIFIITDGQISRDINMKEWNYPPKNSPLS